MLSSYTVSRGRDAPAEDDQGLVLTDLDEEEGVLQDHLQDSLLQDLYRDLPLTKFAISFVTFLGSLTVGAIDLRHLSRGATSLIVTTCVFLNGKRG